MIGCHIFLQMFSKLDEKKKMLFLENAFSIKNISVCSVSLREDKIIFRAYVHNVFYQFIFVFLKTVDERHYVTFKEPRFVNSYIYPFYYPVGGNLQDDEYPYFMLVKLLLTRNQNEFICLFQKFL